MLLPVALPTHSPAANIGHRYGRRWGLADCTSATVCRGQGEGLRVQPAPVALSGAVAAVDLDSLDDVRASGGRDLLTGPGAVGNPAWNRTEWSGASDTGVIMVAGQKLALGRAYRHQTVIVTASETSIAVQLEDGETRTVRRTTSQCLTSKGQRPRTATQGFLGQGVAHQVAQIHHTSDGTRQRRRRMSLAVI